MSTKPNNTHKRIEAERYDLKEVVNSAHGNFNNVTRMQGKVGGHVIHLMRRRQRPGVDQAMVTPNEQEREMRQELHGLGIRVLPTYRYDDKGDVYSTDLTEQGKKYVVSWQNTSFDDDEITSRMHSGDFDAPVTEKAEIVRQVREIAERCADAGIHIKNADGIYLVVDKSSRATVAYAGDYKHYVRCDVPREQLLRMNLEECYMVLAVHRNRKMLGFEIAELKRAFGKE